MVNIDKFRYDINGLRAYAVILVVLFHFQIFGFSAGFIGVDIFFVISGYLMTKIIIDQIMNKRFSIWRFYLARGVRILPALLLLTTVIALIGWFLLIPEDYKSYAKHAASSITFLSNLMYWQESSDYFSAAAHEKILLHTWSLSVEWQFYIILPILLLILGKIKRNKNILNLAILFGFIISLILSYKVSQNSQTTAFYMIPTRAWEMLAGGLVYAYFSKAVFNNSIKNLIEFIGFSLIFISLFIFKTTTIWPSINAILPVLGTMLILVANNNNSFLTKPKFFQLTGNASYSIYLWHWPIVFFMSYLGINHNQALVISGIILSIFLGWISYKFVEVPTRRYLSRISTLKSYMILTSITATLVSVFAVIFIKDGIPNRSSQDYSAKTKELVMPLPSNGWCFYSVDSISTLPIGKEGLECKIGAIDDFRHKALLFGDSYAAHNIPFWDKIGKSLHTRVHPITTNWCYPGLNDQFTGPKSSRAFEQCIFNRKYLSQNMHKYDYLIFVGSWKSVNKHHLDNFENLLAEATKLNIPIIIMASPYSFNTNIGNVYKRSTWLGQEFNLSKYVNDDYDLSRVKANQTIKEVSSKYPNTFFIEDIELYSNNHLTENGFPYSLDGGHISLLGSQSSANYFEKGLKISELRSKLNQITPQD